MKIQKIDSNLLSTKIYNALMELMSDPEVLDKGKLPKEDDIVKLLAVSRTSLRDALALLEKDVIITRRRGFGTMINREVLELDNRLDIKKEFNVLITEAGYQPSRKLVGIKWIEADEDLAAKLNIQAGDKLCGVKKLLAGDDRPLIYCINYLPESLLPDGKFPEEEVERPIYEILEENFNIRIHHEISRITPKVMDEELESIFEVEHTGKTAIQYFTEVAYDIDSNPVMYSEVCQRSDLIDQTLVRRRY